jgi:hypothetical protein
MPQTSTLLAAARRLDIGPPTADHDRLELLSLQSFLEHIPVGKVSWDLDELNRQLALLSTQLREAAALAVEVRHQLLFAAEPTSLQRALALAVASRRLCLAAPSVSPWQQEEELAATGEPHFQPASWDSLHAGVSRLGQALLVQAHSIRCAALEPQSVFVFDEAALLLWPLP